MGREEGRQGDLRVQGLQVQAGQGRFIHAEDEEGRTVEWGRAFGAQLPHQVLSSLAVERIVVRSAEGERILRSLRELMELVQ